jgi:hypothetical protein
MTVSYQADDRIQYVECKPFEANTIEGVQAGKSPHSETQYI